MAGPIPRIDWNLGAFAEIRRLDTLRELLYDYAKIGTKAANESSGGGYVARAGDRPTRARAAVITATTRAIYDNKRHHTLMGRAVDAMKNA